MKILCTPILLPTEGKSNILINDAKDIFLFEEVSSSAISKYWYNQHLYLVSNEPIKNGDWVIGTGDSFQNKGAAYQSNGDTSVEYPRYKIICTTDTSLGLPIIPEDFLQEYVNKQGTIDKVLVWQKDKDIAITLYTSFTPEQMERVKEIAWKSYQYAQNNTIIAGSFESTFESWWSQQNF